MVTGTRPAFLMYIYSPHTAVGGLPVTNAKSFDFGFNRYFFPAPKPNAIHKAQLQKDTVNILRGAEERVL